MSGATPAVDPDRGASFSKAETMFLLGTSTDEPHVVMVGGRDCPAQTRAVVAHCRAIVAPT